MSSNGGVICYGRISFMISLRKGHSKKIDRSNDWSRILMMYKYEGKIRTAMMKPLVIIS